MGHKGKETTSDDLLDRRARPFNPMDAKDTDDLLDMCVEALQDSRCSTREAVLTALAGALEGLPPLDEIDGTCSFNIFALCGICVREGSAREARLACRAVGLLALTLRAGAPAIRAESFPLLRRTLRLHHEVHDAQTVVCALDCLAAVTVAGAQRNKEDVERSMKAVWDVMFPAAGAASRSCKLSRGASATKKTCPKVQAAAVSAWTFLLTTIVAAADAPRRSESAAWASTVASLSGLLDHDDRAVRMAAGEALAVCAELNLTQHVPRRDMDALAAKASDLASEPAGKGANNATLPQQKGLFRQVAAFLHHGERLEESVPTAADGCVALAVSTWAKLAQLNFLRRFLGDGFVKHAEGNELLKEAFGYGADEGKLLSVAKMKQRGKADEDLKVVKRDRRVDWSILCDYPYTASYKPETLLQIGWQALK